MPSALFQPESVYGAQVRGTPGGDECCHKRADGEDQCSGDDRGGVGGTDAKQLGLDELAESSKIPFIVDLHVWDEIPERFREIIRKEYVVVQGGEGETGAGYGG